MTDLATPDSGLTTGAAPPHALRTDRQHAAERRDVMRWKSGTLNESWYVAALSSQVTTKKPCASTVMEESIVLFRGKDGRPAALLDRCLHRNAALSGGDVFDGCIGCPYHGWTYTTSGECVTVPSEGPNERPRASRYVERFPCIEQDGLVWVYMGDPSRATEKEPYRFAHYGERGWQTYYMLTRFDGDVTDLVENFMDVPHTAFVHAGWFRSKTTAKRAEATVERTSTAVLVEYFQPDDSIGFTSWLLNPDRKPMTHTDRFFMPNVTRVDYMWGERRGLVISSQITPVTPTHAVVYTAITFRFGIFNPIARLLLPPYTRIVIDQDVRIMANQTRNIGRFGGRRFHSTEADTIHEAIESLRDYARAGAVGPAPEPFATRIAFWM
jgi:phenylpropionate dioxygenase-like ring-hydroxylating dioxygenase large terminal subunit